MGWPIDNIDWPSKPGLSVAEQQSSLLTLIDQAVRLRLNAIYFQVRPEGDALYVSSIEPWSRWLTGKQGVAPSPVWDPLQFAIDACHHRSIELHAWLNPYRSKMNRKDALAPSHVCSRHPEVFAASILQHAHYTVVRLSYEDVAVHHM